MMDSFQVEIVGGTVDKLHNVLVSVEARVHKTSETASVALGDAVNITTDLLDASRLAWLTGAPE